MLNFIGEAKTKIKSAESEILQIALLFSTE